jgi:hypothetical protein
MAMSRRIPYQPSDIPRTEPHSGHVPASSSRAAANSWPVMSLGIIIGGYGLLLARGGVLGLADHPNHYAYEDGEEDQCER